MDGGGRREGGRGAQGINALFHFKVTEICCSRHIYRLSKSDRFAVNVRKISGGVIRGTARRSNSNLWLYERAFCRQESLTLKDALRSQEG